MEIISDHDSRPLFEYKLPLDFPEQFEWTFLEEGPEVWRAALIKIK